MHDNLSTMFDDLIKTATGGIKKGELTVFVAKSSGKSVYDKMFALKDGNMKFTFEDDNKERDDHGW